MTKNAKHTLWNRLSQIAHVVCDKAVFSRVKSAMYPMHICLWACLDTPQVAGSTHNTENMYRH